MARTDFSSYLLNVANSGADVVVNINFGRDAVLSIKQAKQFGILDKMTLVVPYNTPFLAKEVGADTMQGVFATTDYLVDHGGQEPDRQDVHRCLPGQVPIQPGMGREPRLSADRDVGRRDRAGQDASIRPMSSRPMKPGAKVQSTVGEVCFRGADHQLVRPVVVERGKKPADMKTPEDFYDIVEVVPGEGLMQSPTEFGCKLGGYT